MAFTFTIEKPKVESEKLFLDIKEIIERREGSISGDDKEGRISSYGVEGNYVVGTESIEITIDKKPMIYPEFAVKRYIRKFFSEVSS